VTSTRSRPLPRYALAACAVAGALIASLALEAPGRAGAAPGTVSGAVWDEGGVLGRRERAALERTLRSAGAKTGSPVSILLMDRLPRHESIEAVAREAFGARALDAAGPPQILLAVAKRERQAAIETGRGPAGIVPEIDARQITRRLAGRLGGAALGASLEQAVSAIVGSTLATLDRRRPSPPDPLDDPLPAVAAAPATNKTPTPSPAPEDSEANSDPTPTSPSPPPPGRSRVPAAAMVAALVVLGLALRRRRKTALENAEKAEPFRAGRGR
jgi:MYXO-CTERM domain-containing protein